MKKKTEIVLKLVFLFLTAAVCCGEEASMLYRFESSPEAWTIEPGEFSPLRISTNYVTEGRYSLRIGVKFPGEVNIMTEPGADWSEYQKLTMDIYLPENAPGKIQLLFIIKDKDLLWYEYLNPRFLDSGKWNHVEIDLSGESFLWKHKNHFKPWDDYIRQKVREFGIRFFSKDNYEGYIYIDNIRGIAGIDTLPSAGYGIYNFRVNSPVVDKYGKFEMSFDLPGVYSNPFDPEVIDVSAVFTAPGGRTMTVPGFFHQNYLRKLEGGKEKLVPVGKSEWKIRFSPRKVGTYTYCLKIKDKEGQITTKKRSFRAVPSDNQGLIRVSKKDSSYFEFSNGDFYYPVGHSVIFPVDKRYGRWYKLPPNQETYNFDRYYTRMGKSGENWSRMWLSSGWLALEWKDGWPGYYGVGRYSLQDAWRLDYVLELAKKNGIYVTIVFGTFGQFTKGPNLWNEWPNNPFNRVNGGMLNDPKAYYTDEKHKKHCKNRMRYIIARSGYSTNVLAWELCNEVNGVGLSVKDCRNWHREMARFIKSMDNDGHMVTTSVGTGGYGKSIWNLSDIDYVQVGLYSPDTIAAVRRMWGYGKQFHKPVLYSEFGGDHFLGNTPVDFMETSLHSGLWASYMSRLAGSAMFWWWHCVDDNDLYHHLEALSNFVKEEDRRGRNLRQVKAKIIQGEKDNLKAECLKGDDVCYLWIYNPVALNLIRNKSEWHTVNDARVMVPDIKEGRYKIEFWDTYRVKVVQSHEMTFAGGELILILPPVAKDIACKIKRL